MTPKYMRVAEDLKNIIQSVNELNYKLPTEAALCKKYNVSRQTIRAALDILKREGIITSLQGSGSFAQSVTKGSDNNIVAIIIPHDSYYIYPRLLSDIETKLSDIGLSSKVFTTNNDFAKERQILNGLSPQIITALITIPSINTRPTPNKDLYEKLNSTGLPILFLGKPYPNMSEYFSLSDNDYQGGYFIGKYLAHKGHKNVAGIFYLDDASSIDRHFGLTCALRDEKLPISSDNCLWFTASEYLRLQEASDYSFLTNFVKKKLRHVSSVVCYNEEIAYWLSKSLRENDIHIPSDIGIICFESSYYSRLLATPITTMAHSPAEPQSTLVKMLAALLTDSPIRSTYLELHLSDKGSC